MVQQRAGGGGGTGNGDKKRPNASLPPSADRNPSSSNAWSREGTQAPLAETVVVWGSFNTPKALSRSSGMTSPAFAAPRQNSSAISTKSETACQGRADSGMRGEGSSDGQNMWACGAQIPHQHWLQKDIHNRMRGCLWWTSCNARERCLRQKAKE